MNTVHSLVSVRRLAGIALLGGLLIITTGCARNSIVGKWQGNIPFAGQSLPTTMEFKSDGTDTQTSSLKTPMGQVAIVASGTYAVKDANLEMTPTSVTVNGQSNPMASRMMKSQTMPFKLDGDTLTLTPASATQSVTLTRVKQ